MKLQLYKNEISMLNIFKIYNFQKRSKRNNFHIKSIQKKYFTMQKNLFPYIFPKRITLIVESNGTHSHWISIS